MTLSKSKQLNRKKLPTITNLKKKLWQLCREISFKRHGDTCYCCEARNLTGSNRHLGHFIPSSVCSTHLRYSLDNLRPSCYRCNIHLSGNWVAFEAHLLRDGVDVAALKRENERTKGAKYDALWFMRKIEEYQTILNEL